MNGTAGAAALCALLVALPAHASEQPSQTWETRTWTGYVVRTSSDSFSSVRGTWTQPRVVCTRPGSAVSFWVGLGGARRDSQSLEQVGTSVDCDGQDVLSVSAWYELFPAAPVDIPIDVRAGDIVTASVAVDGPDVLITFEDATTGSAFARRRTMLGPAPESDSAEWIAEAPSACFRTCAPLPVAGFARVRFRDSGATAAMHDGAIADAGWDSFHVTMPFASATRLSENGSAFSVIRTRTG